VSTTPISPELALVDPVLRAEAIAALPPLGPSGFAPRVPDPPARPQVRALEPARRSDEAPVVQRRRSILVAAPAYLAGSLVTSLVFGIAFIATIAGVVLLLNAIG
jgi:hypothetical protein